MVTIQWLKCVERESVLDLNMICMCNRHFHKWLMYDSNITQRENESVHFYVLKSLNFIE